MADPSHVHEPGIVGGTPDYRVCRDNEPVLSEYASEVYEAGAAEVESVERIHEEQRHVKQNHGLEHVVDGCGQLAQREVGTAELFQALEST